MIVPLREVKEMLESWRKPRKFRKKKDVETEDGDDVEPPIVE